MGLKSKTWSGGRKLKEEVHLPVRVKDHPVWKHEDQPWNDYPYTTLLRSMESHYLYRTVLELGIGNYADLGVYRGGSLYSFAHGLKTIGGGMVYGVDLFDSVPETSWTGEYAPYSVEKVKTVFKERNIDQHVQFCKGSTDEWSEKLKDIKFKFIFIDADHSYNQCKRDFELWSLLLEDDGQIAFHDCNMAYVHNVITELPQKGWKMIEHVARIKTFRKKHD